MKKILTLLLPILLSACAAVSSPISFYNCKTGDESINQSISRMNSSFEKYSNTVNNVDFIENKESLINITKTLVFSASIKINNDKYYSDYGNYYQCAKEIDATNTYINGITLYLDKSTQVIQGMKDNESKFKGNCTSVADCQYKMTIVLNAELSKLSP